MEIKVHKVDGKGYVVYRAKGKTTRCGCRQRKDWTLWLPRREFDAREGSYYQPYFDTVKQAVAAAKREKKHLDAEKDVELTI